MYTDHYSIAEEADALSLRYGTRDPFRIAEETDVTVFHTSSLDRLKGLYCIVEHNRFIILNDKNTAATDRVVCAHELGHDRLHRIAGAHAFAEFSPYRAVSRQEYEANLFAASLLLSDRDMLDLLAEGRSRAEIAAMTETDENLVAVKAEAMIRRGFPLQQQTVDRDFLRK